MEKKKQLQESSKVILKIVERSKRKRITHVAGLNVFDVDLKKAAKQFSNKYACGASVAKNNQGVDEIVIQGDVANDLAELIKKTWSIIGEDQISIVVEKKKKSESAE